MENKQNFLSFFIIFLNVIIILFCFIFSNSPFFNSRDLSEVIQVRDNSFQEGYVLSQKDYEKALQQKLLQSKGKCPTEENDYSALTVCNDKKECVDLISKECLNK